MFQHGHMLGNSLAGELMLSVSLKRGRGAFLAAKLLVCYLFGYCLSRCQNAGVLSHWILPFLIPNCWCAISLNIAFLAAKLLVCCLIGYCLSGCQTAGVLSHWILPFSLPNCWCAIFLDIV